MRKGWYEAPSAYLWNLNTMTQKKKEILFGSCTLGPDALDCLFWGIMPQNHHVAGIPIQNKIVFYKKGSNIYSDIYKNSTDRKLQNIIYNWI